MKKLLCSAAALTLMGGAAVAEVTVGGDARMGVVYSTAYGLNAAGVTDTESAWNFSSRVRVKFTLSGETDGGLAFGGSIRADNSGNGANGSAGNVWISGDFGKLSMGDVVGAAEAAFGDLPEIGFTDLKSYGGYDNDVWYLTGDGALTGANNPVLLYQYSAGDLNVYLSLSDGKVGNGVADDDQEYALAVNYSFGDYSVSLGYEVLDSAVAGVKNQTHAIIGGTANFGTTTVKGYYGSWDTGIAGIGSQDHYGVGVSSTFDALTVSGYVHSYENERYDGKRLVAYGIGAAYDLGGGASIVGGIADNNDKVTADGATYKATKPVADIGVKFSF